MCATNEDCTGLTSIEIPDSVTEIGNGAFYSCTGLTSIEIPDSVTEIGSEAFKNCTGLTNIEINSACKDNFSIFERCENVKELKYSDGCTTAFSTKIRSITSVFIPCGVEIIEAYVFQGCKGLSSIEIPNSVTKIGDYAFSGCTGLESIECDDNNEYYKSIDGVLFEKDVNTLIKIPDGKQADIYKIPSIVIELKRNSIACKKINQLFIPSSVSKIDEYAIHADNIKEIFIYHEHPEEILIGKGSRDIKRTDCVLYVPIGTGYAYRHHWFFGEHFNPSLIPDNYFQQFLGVLAELTCWYSSTASCKIEL